MTKSKRFIIFYVNYMCIKLLIILLFYHIYCLFFLLISLSFYCLANTSLNYIYFTDYFSIFKNLRIGSTYTEIIKFPSIFLIKYEFVANATCKVQWLRCIPVSPFISHRNSRKVGLRAAAVVKDYVRV